MNERQPAHTTAIIADDEDLGRLLLAATATASGLEPLTFDNGQAALEAALSRDVAIVLLDVDMPGMDGYAVCRRLRAEARFASVPIVMVTGHEDSGAVSRAFEAGATDFVAKPVNWALLPRRLAYILRNAAAAERIERLAYFDALTGLPNRQRCLETAEQLLIDAAASNAAASESTGSTAAASGMAGSEPAGSTAAGSGAAASNAAASNALESGPAGSGAAAMSKASGSGPAGSRAAGSLAAGSRGQVAVIYLDLNSFKRVNDTFGHSVGDIVLRNVAGKLEHAVGALRGRYAHVSVARFGGDEFVILVSDAAARTAASTIAAACTTALKEPITHDGLEFYSAPSIGIAIYPDDGADVAALIRNADTAMYQAKTSASGSVVAYTPAMNSRRQDWLDLEGRLRRALKEDLLYIHYQPKFRLTDNRLVGVEALVRWLDPDHGEIPPMLFIEIAEESGLIIDLGSWVVRAACRQLRAWQDRGVAVPVAINVSGKELLHGDPARVVESEALAAGVPTSLIEIEITESLLVNDSARVRTMLERLRRLGCRIALDDFGTGYSSLAYITRFPPDRIKIDKAFVHNLERSASDAAVASAILSLGASLNMTVTAEGIERQTQLEWLRKRGCHEAQGFLLSRPLSARDLEERFLIGPNRAVDSDLAEGSTRL